LIGAMVKEIELTPFQTPGGNEIIETLYFGGGTPSLLDGDELTHLTNALQKRFEFAAEPEVTLEVNPDDLSIEKLALWKELGINRLSVGIQGLKEEELIWMNRIHTSADSIQCIEQIRKAGFTNFSADLIFGTPGLSDEDWEKTLSWAIENNLPHVSAYALTVEPRTALFKMIDRGKSPAVDPEKQARQFGMLMERFEGAGYEHYEISNFSKPGRRSRHNSSYWSFAGHAGHPGYYGFGPSAHSYDGKCRRWNIANNASYIRSLRAGIIPFEEEVLTATQQLNEYIMTSLRTAEGLDLEWVNQQFGEKYGEWLKVKGTKFFAAKTLLMSNDRMHLTREGKLFADGIASDLFF
jgi:oxygen-independent coproporphyrinogen III oxidase